MMRSSRREVVAMTIDFAKKASLVKRFGFLSALLVSGCTFSVPQAESSIRFERTLSRQTTS